MNTHQITLGGSKQQPVTFELTNGKEVMERLLSDFKKASGKVIANDQYGFAASLNGHNVAYSMIDIEISMKDVLQNHFKGEKIKYFHQSDAHKNIEGDSYIRYEYNGIAVQVWVGGDSGEVCILNSATPLIVDRLLMIVQFNK